MSAPLEQTGQAPRRIVLSIDAMGGDRGPTAVVAGMAESAEKNADLHFIVHGPKDELDRLIARRKLESRCEVRDARGVVRMDDKPSQVMRHGQDTSMWSAIEAVRNGEAQVCVSCGNTGALMLVSMVRLRKLPGINRPAIAVLWPSRNKGGFNVLLDAGADIKADEQDLLQYAFMGASRAELKLAHDLIGRQAEAGGYDFVGFVEGGDIPSARVDVIVTDGFTGNVALKTGEGTAALIRDFLKEAFKATPLSRIAALLALTSLKRLTTRIDPRRVNGGVFLGLNGTVVKSHGSADATGVSAAIKLAFKLAASGFNERLAARVASLEPAGQDAPQNEAESEQPK